MIPLESTLFGKWSLRFHRLSKEETKCHQYVDCCYGLEKITLIKEKFNEADIENYPFSENKELEYSIWDRKTEYEG